MKFQSFPRLPEAVNMAKRAFQLFFPQTLIKEPVMFVVARDNGLLLNIRRAKITAEAGEATVELEGEDAKIETACKALKKKGVTVEPVTGDIVEG